MVSFDPIARIYDGLPIPTHPESVAQALEDAPSPGMDLGGGTGRFTQAMHPQREPRLLVDASAGMLARARRAKREVRPVQAEAECLPFPDDAIGAVTITEAFHHFAPNEALVLAEVARVLHPEGALAIEEIDPSRWLGKAIALGERFVGFGSVFRKPQQLKALAAPLFASTRIERTGSFTYLLVARGPTPT